ncbi:hypothetical protein LCGC14_2374580 [marine sediment metagenome]|uniref:Uncharacterized protein n=1 Tax=marine sediment metagenome TaxID=412755 RepID=A0A0F9EXE4_9ZZZZ
MSPGRAPVLDRGLTTARARFGPSKAFGGVGPGDLSTIAANKIIEDIIGGRADASEIANAPCDVVRDVVLGTPTADLAKDPAIRAVIQAKAEACRDQANFSFGPGFWDRLALSDAGEPLAARAEAIPNAFTLGGVFEIVGNGVIALTGGLMIWLGAQRTFSKAGR